MYICRYELHVLPKYQRNGLGRRLIDYLEREELRAPYEKLMLTCHLANRDALQFYTRLGFVKDPSCPSLWLTDAEFRAAGYTILCKNNKNMETFPVIYHTISVTWTSMVMKSIFGIASRLIDNCIGDRRRLCHGI